MVVSNNPYDNLSFKEKIDYHVKEINELSVNRQDNLEKIHDIENIIYDMFMSSSDESDRNYARKFVNW